MTATTIQVEVIQAGVEHLEDLTLLFDAYRVWYGKPSNRPAANHYLFERIINHESMIYLALVDGKAAGFTQLYMTFSSIAMLPVWILNDLYVAPDYRQQGVGRALIRQAIDLVAERGDKGLQLETAPDNVNAQRLYEAMGFRPDSEFKHYVYNNM